MNSDELILWEIESCTGGIGGTGVMPWRCQPGSRLCREGSKPSSVTYGLKSSDTVRWELCTHTHVPASDILSSPDRQQWLIKGGITIILWQPGNFIFLQPHHSCMQWEPFLFSLACLIIRNHNNEADITCLDPYFLLWKMIPWNGIIFLLLG